MSIKEYLTFTRRERYGILTLVVLLLLVAFLPRIIPKSKPKAETALPAEQLSEESIYKSSPRLTASDSLRTKYHRSYDEPDRYGRSTGGRYAERYDRGGSAGDPWKTRRETFSGTGGRYERRGFGQYKSYDKHDLRSKSPEETSQRRSLSANAAWGRTSSSQPYFYRQDDGGRRSGIRGNDLVASLSHPASRSGYGRWRYMPVDINTADTSALIALPGIGSKLAARIVSFREKLGGFSTVDQIREVYGLKDSVFLMLTPYLKCDSAYMGKRSLDYHAIR